MNNQKKSRTSSDRGKKTEDTQKRHAPSHGAGSGPDSGGTGPRHGRSHRDEDMPAERERQADVERRADEWPEQRSPSEELSDYDA